MTPYIVVMDLYGLPVALPVGGFALKLESHNYINAHYGGQIYRLHGSESVDSVLDKIDKALSENKCARL